MSLARKQLSIIHVAKAKLGLADGDYRAILRQEAGVDSSRDLDQIGFDAVMRRFESLGFATIQPAPRIDYGVRVGMASPRQVELIRDLWCEYTGEALDEAALNHWLDHFHHRSALRFLTYQEAGKAIGALKAMKLRRRADRAGNSAHG